VSEAVTRALGERPARVSDLGGGHGARVFQLTFDDRPPVVAKTGARDDGALSAEAFMLRYLAKMSRLPVPEVLHDEPGLLIMTLVPGRSGSVGDDAQTHAAELVAALHEIRGAAYGLERDTVIGGLRQPNEPEASWRAFFRDRRLLYMAEKAHEAGRLPGALRARIERFAARLDEWLVEPAAPVRIHGDMWDGNIVHHGGRITGFIDPAIYYADPEIELAFATLFNTFGPAFFDA